MIHACMQQDKSSMTGERDAGNNAKLDDERQIENESTDTARVRRERVSGGLHVRPLCSEEIPTRRATC